MQPMPYVNDVAWLLRRSPYLTLARRPTAFAFVRERVAAGEECFGALADYPRVRVAPLDFHYSCLVSLGALDGAFLDVLLHQLTWRGIVWGAWLVLLDPRPEFLDSISRCADRTPAHNQWLVRGAAMLLSAEPIAPEFSNFAGTVHELRRQLAALPHPLTPLRREPLEAERDVMARERETVRDAYRRGGVEAARGALEGTLTAHYLRDYPAWLRTVRRDGPA